MSEFSAGLKRAWDYTQPRDKWHRISERDYWYCLGVLPPIYFRGGFAVSEPVLHDDKGEAVYLCVREQRAQTHGAPSRYTARLASIQEANAEYSGVKS